ncbi:tetratricopeptide repeat protein [Myxococcus sp. CA051A]|uniref:tetratricopeptide repeat protein n=1 Tax=unclassified Myxococcus TaxID=2648731 RepID=UPI00157BB462|nr:MULTISPECIES: tetratricopeptide repeat protein [unclassified Myxococcus]NTX33725.1 tetratricopeptide repeat protein [Myxococcus sp. CA033]NTX59168.1 tetratricopeptide repeat protein [Myxococcus sp. CA051A]
MATSAARPSSLRPSPHSLLVFVTALAVYAGTLRNGLVYDDIPLVVQNPWLRSLDTLAEAFQRPLFAFDDEPTSQVDRSPAESYFRPLAHVLFFAQRALFGTTAWPHHLVLMLLHGLASLLVGWLLRECLRRPGENLSEAGSWAALAGALLFAVHPVHTESVAWVSGCMDVAATLMVLLSVRLMVGSSGSWRWGVGAGLLWFAGLLFKEVAVVFPVVLWATDRAVGTRPARPGLRGWALRYAPLGLGLLGYAALRLNAVGLSLPVPVGSGRTGLYPLHMLALAGKLLGKLLWPHPLVLTIPLRVPPEPTQVALGSVLLVALLGLLWWKRRDAGPAFAGGVWLLAPLLPVFFLQLRGVEAYAERFLYLPSVGFCLLAATGLRGLLERWREHARAVKLLVGGVVVVCSVLTLVRVPAWHDEVSLWEDTVAMTPGQPILRGYLGGAYLKARRPEQALAELQLAAVELPRSYQIQSDLAVAYALLGRMDLAIVQFERILQLRPGEPVVIHNLGLALRRTKRMEEAVARFQEVLRLAPRRADSHLELGRTLLQMGRPAEAVAPLEEALRLQPESEPARRGLQQARMALGSPP